MKFDVKTLNDSYEKRIIDKTPKVLIDNAMKIIDFIESNCKNAKGTFNLSHNVFSKTDIIVEDGNAYFCHGSHSYGYEWYLCKQGTAHYSQGSCQGNPYLYVGNYGFPTKTLEKILKEWDSIKERILNSNEINNKIYSPNFKV